MRVGIDLGTTNCVIGRIKPDGSRQIPSEIPSIGAWRNGEVVFGAEARKALRSEDTDIHPIRDLKLSIGLKPIRVGPNTLSAEDLAVDLFRTLLGRIGAEDGVEGAVISTPVEIEREHRLALRNAANRAGIPEVAFVYEPTAALIAAHRMESRSTQDNVLVVDWGGGTLDVTVVQVHGNTFREVAVARGLHHLGGTYMDEALTNKILAADTDLALRVESIDGGFERLKDSVEEAKQEILDEFDLDDETPLAVAPSWLGTDFDVHPEDIRKIISDFAQRAAAEVIRNLNASRIGSEQVTHILFAGGVCRADAVQDIFTKYLPHANVLHAGNPQQLTGAGCTELTREDFSVELAAGVGIRQADDSVCVVLPEGLVAKLNVMRAAEFWVTDSQAPEAIADIGFLPPGRALKSSYSESAAEFRTLHTLFLPSGTSYGGLERMTLCMGVEENLTVQILAITQLGNAKEQLHLSGIPLAIRVHSLAEPALRA